MQIPIRMPKQLSSLATAISTASFIEQFNDKDIARFTDVLCKELKIKNQSQLVSKFLIAVTPQLDDDSLENLHVKAQEIHRESQYPIQVYKSTNHDNNNAYDYISSLPNDIIHQIGLYLSATNNNNLGYANRRLYIEFQRLSYVLNINNYKTRLRIDDKSWNTFYLIHYLSGYSFCFPRELCIDFQNHGSKTRKYLSNIRRTRNKLLHLRRLFYAVTGVHIGSNAFRIYPMVPVELIFDKQNANTYGLKTLELGISVSNFENCLVKDFFDQFYQNYTNYFENTC